MLDMDMEYMNRDKHVDEYFEDRRYVYPLVHYQLIMNDRRIIQGLISRLEA